MLVLRNALLCLVSLLLIPASIGVAAGGQSTSAGPDADPSDIFRVGEHPPVQVVFASSEQLPDRIAWETGMGRALAGVLDERTGAQVWGSLNNLVERRTHPRPDVAVAQRLCVAWMWDADGQSKRVEIGWTADGWLLARALDAVGESGGLARLDERRFEIFSADWPELRVPFVDVAPPEAGSLMELAKPYTPSPITLDADTLRLRVFGRSAAGSFPLRNLAEESFFVRFPTAFDARRPLGLLVWIAAVDDPQPPLEVLAPACDEHGLVLVSIANAGNTREIANRLQLVLDAVTNVRARVPIDPARIYLSGISGGGRCASILWACFPETFTGAVPIVGLDSYRPAPTGTGRAWAASYIRPSGKRLSTLRPHRLAVISGENDFNFTEISVRIADLQQDGLDVRLVDQQGMGHEMPTPTTFAEALAWVDEPAVQAAAEAHEKAGKLLERAKSEDGERRQRLLIRIIDDAPWSDAAWEAIDLLKGP